LPRRQPSAVDRAAVSSRPRPRTRAAWLHSRLVSYRLDTSTNPLVSLRERSSSAVKCVRYCRTESECPTSPASVGAPSPTSPPGSGSRRSERRGSLGCPETTSNRGRCRHRSSSKTTHATDGRPHSWSRKTSCTSKPVWLGDRAARRNTERSAPLPCLHGGDQSGVLGMASWQTRHHRSHRLQSLASSKSLGSRGARRTRPKPRPSNTPRSAIQTTVRPPSARRSDSECRFPELLPRDDAPKKNQLSAQPGRLELPRGPDAARSRNRNHPANRTVDRESVCAATSTLGKREDTHRASGCVLRGTPMSPSARGPLVDRLRNDTTPIHGRFDVGRMPRASTYGRRVEARAASCDADPSLCLPSAATTRTRANSENLSAITSCSRLRPAESTAPNPGF
jgi:hypothetical protein